MIQLQALTKQLGVLRFGSVGKLMLRIHVDRLQYFIKDVQKLDRQAEHRGPRDTFFGNNAANIDDSVIAINI
jgi:hypothetical protein